MYRYSDNTETQKDKTYQKVKEQLNIFMEHLLLSEEDKHLFSKMVSECCDKHYEAIKSMEGKDPGLITPLIMALIVDQQSMIDRLKVNNC